MLGRIAVKNKFYSELSSLVGSSSIKDNIPVVICDSDDLDSRNWVFEKLLKLLLSIFDFQKRKKMWKPILQYWSGTGGCGDGPTYLIGLELEALETILQI